MVYYHLSYDVISAEENFENYRDAKHYILCVLKRTALLSIASYNASSFVLKFENEQPQLFRYLENQIGQYFYYTISQIQKNIADQNIWNKKSNISIQTNFQNEWNSVECPSDLNIGPYI